MEIPGCERNFDFAREEKKWAEWVFEELRLLPLDLSIVGCNAVNRAIKILKLKHRPHSSPASGLLPRIEQRRNGGKEVHHPGCSIG